MFDIDLPNRSEYEGAYLGGSIQHGNGMRVLLRFSGVGLGFFQFKSDKSQELFSNKPFISMAYNDIIGIQVVNQERISSLRWIVLGAIPGLLWRTNDKFLLLLFKDSIGLEQSLVFRFKDNWVVQSTIQNKVAQHKVKE
jgi:hypothetical protein